MKSSRGFTLTELLIVCAICVVHRVAAIER